MDALDQLGINGWNLIVQLVAFILFVYLLWRLALGPIVRVLDQRSDRIKDSIEAAQQMQNELQATAAPQRRGPCGGAARRAADRRQRPRRRRGDAGSRP